MKNEHFLSALTCAVRQPVDPGLSVVPVGYVFEGKYHRDFIEGVPLLAVVLRVVAAGPGVTVQEVLNSLPPLPHVYFFTQRAVIASHSVLSPSFFVELLGYVMQQWFEERETLEELLRDALDMMSLIDAGKSASSKWIAARDRLIVKARIALTSVEETPSTMEEKHERTAPATEPM